MFGGQGNDVIAALGGEDDLVGGHNVARGNDGSDLIDGGGGNDVIAGDNALDPPDELVRQPARLHARRAAPLQAGRQRRWLDHLRPEHRW